MTTQNSERANVQYEINDNPPLPLTVGLAFQLVVLTVGGVLITPIIIIQAANVGEPFLSWSVFVVLLVCGLTTILQAVRIGRFGSGHVLLMGTSGAFIAVCVTALVNGGPALMCTLIIVSSIVQFALAFRLSIVRRIVTPTVAGIVIMLIPVTVLPIVFDLLTNVSEEHLSFNAPLVAGITIVVATLLAMRATGMMRLWTPLIGLLIGTIVAIPLGLFDAQPIIDAPWIGLPEIGWPGLDLSFGPEFWALLPPFIFVTVVGLIETIGDSVAIQRVSQRVPKAPDYRVVQGAVGADGVGNLLSGLFGTVPNTTYSSSVAVTEITGVASRKIGVYIGVIFLVIAFIPKLKALVIALPQPVIGAYVTVLLALLFVVGIKLVMRDGLDYRKSIITGVSLWIGAGFQFNLIFPELLTESGFWVTMLTNGMTVGGIVAILLTLTWELLGSRRRVCSTKLSTESLGELNEFLTTHAAKWKWNDSSIQRLIQVNEELVLTLLGEGEQSETTQRNLHLMIRNDSGTLELEYIASTDEDNIEDRAMMLQDATTNPSESELSLRILQHLASDVRHQKYFNMDVMTLHVNKVAD